MAMTTSRMSLDTPPSLIDLPPLPNPHTLPGTHPRLPGLPSMAHSLTRRVSSDSHPPPGRASPSPRISRRTPVPFLLEAFPVPPSHIPATPTSLTSGILSNPSLMTSAAGWMASPPPGPVVSMTPFPLSNSVALSPSSPKSVTAATLSPHCNPPPSLPPTGPLPPIPGSSSVAVDAFPTQRVPQSVTRSGSMTESGSVQRPRLSIDIHNPIRSRCRQGSLSSLRNPIYPIGEPREVIVEESCLPLVPPTEVQRSPPIFGPVAERRSLERSQGDGSDIPHPCVSRMAAPSLVQTGDKLYAEDSLANVDMSDLSALKSDNEGDDDDQASCPFPRCPPLPHLLSQAVINSPPIVPSHVQTPHKLSNSSVRSAHVPRDSEDLASRYGAISPEIKQIISATPRPRKHSTPSRSREPSSGRNRKESCRTDTAPVPTSSHPIRLPLVAKAARMSGEDERVGAGKEKEGYDSDSSLDLHTPLPELMLRHGMLSPNSKLLPQGEVNSTRLSIMSGLSSSSHASNASNISLMSTTSTCSKHPKDARDTPQRRVRHRDGKLLKGGIGLTTGLGWSDSEDEDAPSQLTRRVSSLVLSRRSSVASYRSNQSNSPHPLARSISHNILREIDEQEYEYDDFGCTHRTGFATRSLPSRSKPVSRVGSVRSTGSSTGRYSTYSSSSVAPSVVRVRAGSISETSAYAPSLPFRPDTSFDARTTTGLMPGIRENDDGVTPTRAAFERSSLGSLNGTSGPDIPHTPSSTASSASLPFPSTPDSGAEIPQLQPVYNQDKVLPPLPPGPRVKYPSSLGLQSKIGALQRPRSSSNASSVSNSSIPALPSAEAKSLSASQTSTPRQSLGERSTKSVFPSESSRPSLNVTPRPSLTIPKSPIPLQSGLPRPTTPSSQYSNSGQAYTPRPLRLVSRSSPLPLRTLPADVTPIPPPIQAELNQTSAKALQPGEQSPRPGQVLTYNRNLHDQLKLRTLSLNRTQAPAISPGVTQTLVIPSPGTSSSSNSAIPTPVTARSQSPSPSLGLGGEGIRPKPRTGTGMVYRTNLSVGSPTVSRIRAPSTVSR